MSRFDEMPRREENEEQEAVLEGRNAVLEAFRSGRTIDKLYVQKDCRDGAVMTILREAKKTDCIVNMVSKDRLDSMSETKAHRGVIARAAAYAYSSLEDILLQAEKSGEDPFIVLLDGVEDPHNLGAVIRTAGQAGAHGVIIPKHRSAGITPAAAKASAGAVNHVPVAKVSNIGKTLGELKKKGIKVGIITDGRPEGQRNKLNALGLAVDDVIITDELGGVQFRKPCDIAFRIMTTRWRLNPADVIYVGDNPAKDFQAPQQLGMKSIWFRNVDGIYNLDSNIDKCRIDNINDIYNFIQ